MSLLRRLCSLGLVEEVRAALDRGEDVNHQNLKNETVLMYTAAMCIENQIPILRLLLEQPLIEVNLTDDGGLTALHMATGNGNTEAVKILLADERVDVNCKDSVHRTPLIMASQNVTRIGIFKLFLAEQRVDVNFNLETANPELGDTTVLMCSTWSSNVEAVELLLDHPRVDVNWMNSCGTSALHVAAVKASNLMLLKLFLAHQRVDVNCKCDPFGTVLHVAAANNNVEAVKLILAESRFTSANELGVAQDPDPDKVYVFTAVTTAASKGNWEVLKELVHRPNIDLGVKDNNGLGLDDLTR